jgi:hypothetical protein
MLLLRKTKLRSLMLAIFLSLATTLQPVQGVHSITLDPYSPLQAPTRLFTGDALEGTFISLKLEHLSWSQDRWREALQRLRSLGFDTLILQWSAYDDVSFVDDGGADPGTVERILTAADVVGLDVYVGLALRGSWWRPDEVTPAYLNDELSRNADLAADLQARLGDAPAFRGWYVPHEYSEIVFSPEQREAVLGFYETVTQRLKQLDPLKFILASGYTDPTKTHIVRFALHWQEFLDRAGIDILIFQDGAGLARASNWRDILSYLEALSILDEEFEGDVWFLIELFAQISGPPLDQESFHAESADFARIREQLEEAGFFRKKLVAYSYFDYMHPGTGPAADALFAAYRGWLDAKLRALSPPRP